ncbi:carbohydrate-binding domain-containing protein [Galactobacter sp.]|uniref:carbohydrate-binding domain-containing protein n=1 Tax=Galactobacter sp. TaxID=2676125 RepID=UPI0025C70CE5|nr:carbohydrate-binding domain-containing protein [Galactobacter sp.]
MKRHTRYSVATSFTALGLTAALLAGCSSTSGGASTAQASTVTAYSGKLDADTVMADNNDYTTVNDDEYSVDDALDVTLSGTGATSDADGVTSEDGVVTITEEGVYRLSGDLEGQVVVAAPDDAQVVLILDGVTITNSKGPAIEVRTADDAAIYLAKGSKNTVSDASSYDEDAEANAAIYSDSDLTISGTGSLTVKANGNDGITSKNDLVILSGTITVKAKDDALRGKDALVVEGGTLNLTASEGDGLKSDQEDDETKGYVYVTDGTITIEAGDDGIQSQTDTVITGGKITAAAADDGVKGEKILSVADATVTVTKSTEAMEAANIAIFSGTVDLAASDDGINASGNSDSTDATTQDDAAQGTEGAETSGTDSTASSTDTEPQADGDGQQPPAPDGEMPAGDQPPQDGQGQDGQGGPGGGMAGGGGFADTGERLEISGGTVTVNAEGDGLDSNGSLTITGGTTTVYGPTRGGNGSTDANGDFKITGGTLASFGPGSMEVTPSTEEDHASVLIQGVTIAEGQEVKLQDADGNTVASATSKKAATSFLFSSEDITSGEKYTLVIDGEEAGSATASTEASEEMGGMGQGGPSN